MEYRKDQPPAWQDQVKPGIQLSLWQQFSGSLFLILFGGVFLYFLVPEIGNYFQAKNWRSTPCTIVSSTVERRMNPGSTSGQRREHSQSIIHFTYEIDGRQYTSNRYSFINPATSDARADNISAKYPVGSTATCYVNLDKPGEAVLNRSFSLFNLLIFIPLPFFVFGIWGIAVFTRNLFSKLSER